MAIDNAAQLFVETVHALSSRAPAIVAAAARELAGVVLGLHFGDGSHAELRPQQSRLLAQPQHAIEANVEAYFDNRAMNLLFDLEHQPVDELLVGSLDVRGERPQVLATWRCFRLLSQRASGLRAVQTLWRAYRARIRSGGAGLPRTIYPTCTLPSCRARAIPAGRRSTISTGAIPPTRTSSTSKRAGYCRRRGTCGTDIAAKPGGTLPR